MPILVFLLLFGYGWASLLPNGCPADFSINRLLPHETECGKFYACSNGRRVLMQCPRGLSFDEDLQICDWPPDIDSTTPRTTPLETTTTRLTTSITNATTAINTTTPIWTANTSIASSTTNYTTTVTAPINTTTPIITTTTPINTTTPIITTTIPINTTTPIITTTTNLSTTTRGNYTTSTSVMTTLPTTTTVRPIPPHDCPSEWQVMLKLPENSDCDKYFHCTEDIKLLLKCPQKKMKSFDMVFSANFTKKFRKGDF